MSEEIELKPFVERNGVEYKVIQITDVALHTSRKRPTKSIGKKISRCFKNMKAERIYSPIREGALTADSSLDLSLLSMDEDLIQMIREEEAKGYKILLSLPKGGLPIVAGEDTIEFMKSKNGKRLMRGLAKKKNNT